MSKSPLIKLHNENKLPKRVDKALVWLANSRNTWKEKCMEAKLRLKRQTFSVKRVKDGRDEWKLRHIRLKQKLIKYEQNISILQRRIDELESHVEDQRKEIHEVKKKR